MRSWKFGLKSWKPIGQHVYEPWLRMCSTHTHTHDIMCVCICRQAEEVQLLRDSLRSLRNDFRDHDPQHHTLDTLEQGIVSLIDRLHLLHTQRVPTPATCLTFGKNVVVLKLKRDVDIYPNAAGKREISKTQRPTHGLRHPAVHKWVRVSDVNALKTQNYSAVHWLVILFISEVCQSHNGPSASTKILYFIGKSPTPSMINIPKRYVCVCMCVCLYSVFLFWMWS